MMKIQYIVEDGFILVEPYVAVSRLYSQSPQARERAWLLTHLQSTLVQLRLGLEECHTLLSPPPPPPQPPSAAGSNPSAAVGGGSSTLVLTTPRHETVKGHVTRVGTQLVRGTVSLRLKTLPPQTLTLSPARPLRLAPLFALQGLLVRSVELLRSLETAGAATDTGKGRGKKMRRAGDWDRGEDECREVAIQLRVLARYLADALVLIKGGAGAGPSFPPSSPSSASSPSTAATPISVPFSMPPPSSGSSSSSTSIPRPRPARTPTSQAGAAGWTTHSASLTHFFPPPPSPPAFPASNPSSLHSHSQTHSVSSAHLHHHLHSSHHAAAVATAPGSSSNSDPLSSIPRNISIYLTIEDASLVLYVRALETAGQPTSLGARLALAIGTTRRIDHDEADRLFSYACDDESRPVGDGVGSGSASTAGGGGGGGSGGGGGGGGSSGFLTVGGGGARPVSSSGHGLSVSVPGSSTGAGGGHGRGEKHRPVSSSGIGGRGEGGMRSGRGRGEDRGQDVDKAEVEAEMMMDEADEADEAGADQEPLKPHTVDVYVREKVRVESADPSLLSLSAKLGALSNALALARRNLDVVLDGANEFD